MEMANWTAVEGTLNDGKAMGFYIAELEGSVCATAMYDAQHPKSPEEFEWRLGAGKWVRCDSGGGSAVLHEAVQQVKDYFAGLRMRFSIPLSFQGTAFQNKVWQELTRIPFGETKSYGDIAEAVCCPSGFRAVGGANGKNRIPLFVPCHRVIASGGKLGGFTGGLGLKIRLLNHEDSVLGIKTRWRPTSSEVYALRNA